MSGLKKHRIFITINLPIEIKKQLSRYRETWSDLPAKWVTADNLHITLSFLGYITDTQLGEACVSVKQAVEEHQSFNLDLNKIRYGPIGKNPPRAPKFSEKIIGEEDSGVENGKLRSSRMVWLMGDKSKELSSLRRDIENALAKSTGFKPEERSFSPHITLARINMMEFRNLDLEERPEINENVNLGFEVMSVEVMESELKWGGPQYTIIESYQLNSV